MKLMFLGSGSAFTVGADNFQSNMLFINEQGSKLLIDCGTDIRWSLNAAGFSYLDISDIYISHLHADHVGGLEYIGFTTKFDPRCSKPKLYATQKLASDLWNKTLSGGMRSIEGEVAELETYFELQDIVDNTCFIWSDIKFTIVSTIHVKDGECIVPSYGLSCNINGKNMFLTTDTQFSPDKLGNFYESADIIFHDCETTPFKSPIHSHYEQLVTLPENVRNKMWLYHYQPGKLPDAKKDGFRGFVKRGQIFDFADVATLTFPIAAAMEI